MRHLLPHLRRISHRVARREDGFTMIAAIVILFTTSLLVTVTLVSTGGDIALTHNSINQKKAYYAALAGISAYQYELNTNSSYWKSCPTIPKNKATEAERTVQGTEHETTPEHYVVETMPSEEPNGTSHSKAECESGKQSAIIQTKGSADGTFRIESTGTVGTGSEKVERKLVATFSHPGFLNYVYLTNFEVLDPAAQNPEPTGCEHYYKERVEKGLTGTCGTIEFAPEDKVNGPLHTNDAVALCASGGKKPTFGRKEHKDKIEIDGGHYAASGCSNEWDMLGEYTEKGPVLTPPETDTELLPQAEQDKALYTGRTEIELKTGDTMKVTNNKGENKIEDIPSDGVIYVENEGSCNVKYSPFGTDTDYETDQKCGDVYVHGEYTEQLTIAAQNDVIINGNIKTKTNAEGEPEGEGMLGLIATNFVRVYHPVKKGYETKEIYPISFVATAQKGKCDTPAEASAKIVKSTEVSEISTTSLGLAKGDEVEGTGIEKGTTISEVKASENKIKLSKAATPTPKEYSGIIGNSSTEVTNITTTVLAAGDEVAGTGIENGTTITEVKSGNKIKLSKAAKTSSKELSATITKNSTEVTNITTTNLKEGETVEGTGIESGTTISKVESGKIKLSKAATKNETSLKYYPASEEIKLKFYGETVTLKFYIPMTGYAYDTAKGECYKEQSGYEFKESEERLVYPCESGSTYTTGAYCEFENSSKGCSSKAENENASEDPKDWGALENPVIDAAILSTAHSFIVDNYSCGKHLGNLTVWGAIAQFWRGPVGTGSNSTGYTKNYNYDERLKDLQPPDFLTPTSSKLTLDRITSASS